MGVIAALVTAGMIAFVALAKKVFVVVSERENIVRERFGDFDRVLEPGFHLMLPVVHRSAYRHEMREQAIDVPPQSCITSDNIQVEVDGIVYLKVVDAKDASYGISDYRLSAINLAQTTMRSEIGKLKLDETFSERETINERIVKEIDKASEPWGIKVLRYEIKNIVPSQRVIDTMEKQMEAERQKRAAITMSTGQKEAAIAVSEGERTEAVNLSEGEKQKRINEAEGRAAEIRLLAEATAEGIRLVAEAIQRPGGAAAVQTQLVEQYIDELGTILSSAKVSVVPAGLANLKGFFEGVANVSGAMDHKPAAPPPQPNRR
jgi:regulator of protease activity HflC (stomatin/prohibitin superfamily)